MSRTLTLIPEGSQSIGRALGMVDIVSRAGEAGARLHNIAAETDLHIATARRILQALVSGGFLAFDERTKVYTVGPAIFSYAVQGSPWFARREIFMPALERIAEATRDTVLFSIRSGAEAVCLARREGEFPIRVMSLDTGARRPLGAGSGSLAILAFLPEAEREMLIEQNASLFGAYKLTAVDVRRMIGDARRAGYAFNPGRILDGVYGIAIPIIVSGYSVASISVTAIASRMQPERRQQILKTMSSELSSINGIEFPESLQIARVRPRKRVRG